MPIYEYECAACSHEFETIQKFSDDPLTVCPECSEPKLAKKISAAAFHLKGTGWYETDFKDKKKDDKSSDSGDSDTSTKKDSDSSSDASSSKSADTKSDSPKASKSDSTKKSTKKDSSKKSSKSKKGGGSAQSAA